MKKTVSPISERRITEKCSSVACEEKPIIEIVAWDGITLDTHLYLCRKHWIEKENEDYIGEYINISSKGMKIIKFVKDLRTYL